MCPNPHLDVLMTELEATSEEADETVATIAALDGDARHLTVHLGHDVSHSFRQTSGASWTQPPELS